MTEINKSEVFNRMEKNTSGITDEIDKIVKEYFPKIVNGINGLHEYQLKAIEDIISHKDVMVLMPTAGGKSACYQIPALYWKDGITIVVSPLSALIIDQVISLNRIANEDVATIFAGHSTTDMYYGDEGEEREKKKKDRIDGIIKGKYRIVYITPEMLNNPLFLRTIRKVRDKVRMIAIDEAHCISMWGYSFRPNYLNIKSFIASFTERPVIAAFTATATKPIQEDILRILDMKGTVPCGSSKDTYDRSDLTYHIEWVNILKNMKTGDSSEEKSNSLNYRKGQIVVEIIRKYVANNEKGIIFCSSTNQVEFIASYIESAPASQERLKGKLTDRVSRYYGKDVYRKEPDENGNRVALMDDDVRSRSREDFIKGKSLIMVATNAFGMGINMSDIKYAIHFNIPNSIENYCQEVGRVARDTNMHGDCYLLYNRSDSRLCYTLLNSIPYSDRRKRANKRFEYFKKLVEDTITKSFVKEENRINHVKADRLLREGFKKYFDDENIDSEGEGSLNGKNNQGGLPLYVNRTYVANELRKGDFAGLPFTAEIRKLQKENGIESGYMYTSDGTNVYISKGRYIPMDCGFRRLDYKGSESYVEYKLYPCDTDWSYYDDFNVDEDNVTLSYFDMMIADAVYSLWINNKSISHKSIWKILSGDENVTVQKEKKKIILDSLWKLTRTFITIKETLRGKYGFVFTDEEELYGNSNREYEGAFLKFKNNPFANYRNKPIENYNGPWELEDIPPLYLHAEIQCQFHVFSKEQLYLRHVKRNESNRIKSQNVRYSLVENKALPSSIETTVLKHYFLRRIDMLPLPGVENRVVKDFEEVVNAEGKKEIKGIRAEKNKHGASKRKQQGTGVLSHKVNLCADGAAEIDKSLLTVLGLFDVRDYYSTNDGTQKEYVYKREYQYRRLHKKIFGEVKPYKDSKTSEVSFEYVSSTADKTTYGPIINQILDYYIWLSTEMQIGNLRGYEAVIDDNYVRFEAMDSKVTKSGKQSAVIEGRPDLCTQLRLYSYSSRDKRDYSKDVGKIVHKKRQKSKETESNDS